MKNLMTLISILALGMSSSALIAQNAESEMNSQDESQTVPTFASMDANSDGFLNKEELTKAGRSEEMARRTVEQADTNDDDRISRAEYQALINAQVSGR